MKHEMGNVAFFHTLIKYSILHHMYLYERESEYVTRTIKVLT